MLYENDPNGLWWSLAFESHTQKFAGLTARVILRQALSIATCGRRTHSEVTANDWMPKLLTTRPLGTSLYII